MAALAANRAVQCVHACKGKFGNREPHEIFGVTQLWQQIKDASNHQLQLLV